MNDELNERSSVDMLVAVLKGTCQIGGGSVSVLRSHRFPAHLFVQIENMARIANAPISLVINELIECGLEAVKQKLPAETVRELSIHSKPVTKDRRSRKK